jgi:hypothetical protein
VEQVGGAIAITGPESPHLPASRKPAQECPVTVTFLNFAGRITFDRQDPAPTQQVIQLPELCFALSQVPADPGADSIHRAAGINIDSRRALEGFPRTDPDQAEGIQDKKYLVASRTGRKIRFIRYSPVHI